MNRPLNIVYIHSHDTGRIVEPYGYPVPTPNLMRFAGESTLFGSMFCTNPTCSPSRASLLTGRYAHSCGQFGLAHRGFVMPDFSHHLARFLAGHGYRTALAGVQHVAHGESAAAEIGYDEYLGAADVADRVAADWLLAGSSQPFFLSCGFHETHREFSALPETERDGLVNGPGAAVNFHAAPEPKRAVRTERYKLIRRYDNRVRPVLSNVDDGPSKAWWLEQRWGDAPVEPEQLYDLYADPFERANRIRDERLAAVRDAMRQRLDRWMEETDDPLLRGPLEPPETAVLNSPDGASPREAVGRST